MMTMSMGKFWKYLLLVLLILASYICFYLEFWQPRCMPPFVEIHEKCYFFSTNKATTYDYYKISYKGHIFSVPAELDWLQAGFACETIDPNAQLLTIRSAKELQDLTNYMWQYAHSDIHPFFWSGGHLGNFATSEVDHSTLEKYYWHYERHPMNFTKFIAEESSRFPTGYCIFFDFVFGEMFMATANCQQKMAYACELKPMH